MSETFGPVDAWRYRLPCRYCGAPAVVVLEYVTEAECGGCLRARHGAPVVVRASLDPAARLGQGGAVLPVGVRRREAEVSVAPAAPVVLDAPEGSPPGAVVGLIQPAESAGWTVRVTRSAAIVPLELYAASNKGGKAGQIKRPAYVVDVACLRVRRSGAVGYGTWRDGLWAEGAAADGAWHQFGTLIAFKDWLGIPGKVS